MADLPTREDICRACMAEDLAEDALAERFVDGRPDAVRRMLQKLRSEGALYRSHAWPTDDGDPSLKPAAGARTWARMAHEVDRPELVA